MKKLIWILPVLLLIGLVIFTQKSKIVNLFQQQSQNTTKAVDAEYEITGILRDMYLDDEQKTELKLVSGIYQVQRINSNDAQKLPYQAKGIYLEKVAQNPNSLLGKCVTVKGKIDKQWLDDTAQNRDKNDKFFTQHIMLNVDSISQKQFSDCEGYSKDNDVAGMESQPKKVLMGIVERSLRSDPTTDVPNYYIKSVSQSEYASYEYVDTETHNTDIAIEPATNAVWENIENKIRERIVVEGYETDKGLVVIRTME
jgi:hypothetical protein